MKRVGSGSDDGLGPRFDDAVASALRPATLEPERAARLRARVLARAQAEPRAPTDLRTVRSDEGDWTPSVGSIQRKVLFEDAAARTRSVLIRLGPGAEIRAHGHGVHEECLVLEGEVSIGDLLLRQGDYHLALPGALHPVVRSERGALVFLREEMREIPPR